MGDKSNAADLAAQPFYRHMEKHYAAHIAATAAAIFAVGQFAFGGQGLPFLVYGFCLRTVWVWHVTWFVNSASHLWGYQSYNTGDLSVNNWRAPSPSPSFPLPCDLFSLFHLSRATCRSTTGAPPLFPFLPSAM